MESSLENLLAEGVIEEVIGRLKTGKEAEVYLVRHGTEIVAAKIYKEREFRSFKANVDYKEGRTVRNSRTQRAMDRGSKFGQKASEDAWKSAEADALYKLHAAGVRVPTPVMFLDGVLLMELVSDPEGHPAPRLIDLPLDAPTANAAYLDVLSQIVKMLVCDLIHGDLSPYNILWGAAGPTIIDFPQTISASHNSLSEKFFTRDVENVRRHFASYDPTITQRNADAHDIWKAYVKRELANDFMPSGKHSVQVEQQQAKEASAPPPRPKQDPPVHQGKPPRSDRPRQENRPQQQQNPPRQQDGNRAPQQKNQPRQHEGNRAPQQQNQPRQPEGNRAPQQHKNQPRQQDGNRPPQQQNQPRQHDGDRPQQQQNQPRQHDGNRQQRPPRQQQGQPRHHEGNRPPQQQNQPRQHDGNRPQQQQQQSQPRQHDGNRPPRGDRPPRQDRPAQQGQQQQRQANPSQQQEQRPQGRPPRGPQGPQVVHVNRLAAPPPRGPGGGGSGHSGGGGHNRGQ